MTGQLVTVTPYGRAGASARVRVFDWLDHLGLAATSETYLGRASAGLRDVLESPRATVEAELRLRSLAKQVSLDTVLLCRNASSLSTGRLESALLRRSHRGVYDVDDALMFDRGSGPARLVAKARVWKRAVESADVVVAGNEMLADAAASAGADVVLIPSCVEPAAYVQKSDYGFDGRPPRAVWLGSPSTEKYLGLVAKALLAENQRSGLRLRVISRGHASLGSLDAIVDRVEWTLGGFASALVDGDVGIMPLPDEPWARGKCAYKLLQYGAAALPMIGSPVGANRGALTVMGGTAAGTLDEWTDALAHHVDASVGTRAAAGARARAGVEQGYSFASWAPTWRRTVLGEGEGST